MVKRRACIAAAVMLWTAVAAQAQNPAATWPNKPVRVLLGFPPGGGPDITVRAVGERLLAKTGQPIIVDNRPAGVGQIATEAAFKAPPDGYTLLCAMPAFTTTPFLYANLPFNSDELMPITVMAAQPNVLIVNTAKLPQVRTFADLVAYARANPGKLSYGSTGNGGSQHLLTELIKMSTGDLRIVHVPYKGVAVMAGVIAGEVDMTFFALGSALQNIRSGKLRALAVTSQRRSSLLPDVPMISEVVPGIGSAATWFAMMAPPRTAPDLVNRIHAELVAALHHPDTLKRLADITADVVANSPAEAAAFLLQEKERWGKVIRAANIRAD